MPCVLPVCCSRLVVRHSSTLRQAACSVSQPAAPCCKANSCSTLVEILTLLVQRAWPPFSLPWPTAFNMACHALAHRDSVQSSDALQVHELRPEMLADARARLVSGLKRYFHQKRIEGLLSSTVSAPNVTAASRPCTP